MLERTRTRSAKPAAHLPNIMAEGHVLGKIVLRVRHP